MGLLCIIPGPKKVLRAEPAGDRWCFGCRERLPHTWELLDYDEGSPHAGWYDPIEVVRCSRCGRDRTRFGQG